METENSANAPDEQSTEVKNEEEKNKEEKIESLDVKVNKALSEDIKDKQKGVKILRVLSIAVFVLGISFFLYTSAQLFMTVNESVQDPIEDYLDGLFGNLDVLGEDD